MFWGLFDWLLRLPFSRVAAPDLVGFNLTVKVIYEIALSRMQRVQGFKGYRVFRISSFVPSTLHPFIP